MDSEVAHGQWMWFIIHWSWVWLVVWENMKEVLMHWSSQNKTALACWRQKGADILLNTSSSLDYILTMMSGVWERTRKKMAKNKCLLDKKVIFILVWHVGRVKTLLRYLAPSVSHIWIPNTPWHCSLAVVQFSSSAAATVAAPPFRIGHLQLVAYPLQDSS